jgi:hypothetical protein
MQLPAVPLFKMIFSAVDQVSLLLRDHFVGIVFNCHRRSVAATGVISS